MEQDHHDRGRYEPIPLALQNSNDPVESVGLRPNTPQKSPRRGSGSPLSRTAMTINNGSPRPAPDSSRASLSTDSKLLFDFDSHKQFRKLFRRGLVQFLMTFLIASLLLLTIWQFGKRRVISTKWKRWFNAINLGLSMALGMSVQRGFKGMAIDLRWWILSRRRRSLSEVDKILRSESLTVVAELLGQCLWQNPLKWKVKMISVCMLWLFINLAAQIAIAIMGLNYSTVADEQFALTKPGPVLVPDLTQIYPVGFSSQPQNSVGAQQYTANSFGNMALSFGSRPVSDRPDKKTFWTPGIYYFWPDDYLSWEFVFFDWATTGDIAVYTNRSVNTTWTCNSWIVLSGGNGTSTNLTVLNDANGGSFNVVVPKAGGPDQTTFFSDPDANCGPGCSIVEAFEVSTSKSWYYNCNITVGTVQNATLPEHEIGINLRRMAANGIALQGYGLRPSLPGAQQYQVYPSQSTYGQRQDGDENGMGNLIGQFAIGVIAASAIYTNQSLWLTVTGDQPQIGSQLQIDHFQFVWLILGLIVAAQGVGFVVAAFWANRVIVKDESVLATATLLRSAIKGLENSGNAAKTKAIFESLNDTRVIYTAPIHLEDKSLFHLEFSSHPRARRIRAFPEGTYD